MVATTSESFPVRNYEMSKRIPCGVSADSSRPSPGRRGVLTALWSLPLAALVTANAAHAHGPGGHGGKPKAAAAPEQKPWGIAGQGRAVSRTVDIRMGDDMRFQPAHLDVRLGETLRLRIANRGKLLHELVIGTPAELKQHAELMKKFPNMEHDEPYMAHVDPGKRGEILWHFNRAGEFQFACLIPGHFEAGMVGTIRVTAS